MAINIPVPKIVPDVGPGGPISDVYNRLTQSALEQRKRELENQYYGQTAQANALSKLAYANLMGPQFLAKMMGNEQLLANLPDDQKRQALQAIYRAGSDQGTGNALRNFVAPPSDEQFGGITAPIMNMILDKIKRKDAMQESQPQDALLQSPQSQMRPSINQQQEFGEVNRASPQEVEQNAQYGNLAHSFAENVGIHKGIVREGEEEGKIRATDREDLNTQVFKGEANKLTYDELANILSNPEFRKLRQLPALNQHELGFYAKYGTPAQREMVGKFYALTGNIIKNSARDFPGQFRKGEQALLSGMKPTDSDTIEVAVGKAQTLAYLDKLFTERARLTSQIMGKNHVDKLTALDAADKQLNFDKIKKQIEEKFEPKITLINKKTGAKQTVTLKKARKMGIPNV